ncbi:hypothetical protein NHX12_021186, partial [Muraenolepis orangiensis]
HPSAAQMLRDVGAVEFLTQLSPNVEPRLRAVIDGTLDQLFMLPDPLPSYTAVPSSAHGHAAATPPALPEEDSAKIGYFHMSRPGQTDAPPQRIAVCESVKCLKFSMFPWLPLTTTDRHILSSNESSLRSSNPHLVRTTCQLLRDVIMQDFPAEIFLQRPSIVQALGCLHQLCVGLRTRLRFHQDPGFTSAKQADAVSQNSSLSHSLDVRGTQPSRASSSGTECSPRPSVLGRTCQRARGDGQDGDVASDSGSSHRGGGGSGGGGGGSGGSGGGSGAGAAAAAAGPVSGQASQSPAGAEPPLDLPVLGAEDTLELQLRQLSVAQFAVATMERAIPLLKTGRETWLTMAFCSLYIKPNNYFQFLSIARDHRQAADHLPESTVTAVFHLCLDPALGHAFPDVREAAVAYLEQADLDGHQLHRRGDRNWLELLELAEHATDGLPYHQHLAVIKECVHACSYLWGFDQPSPLLLSESQRLLLKLLSHPLQAVKTEAYACTLRLVKECLGIQNASRPACSGIHFLLHRRVLYEISAFGLQDSAEKVNAAARDALLFLLNGRRMMTASTWDSGGSDASGATALPDPCRLRAALRLLFTKKPKVRLAAVEHILPHLTGGSEASEAARPDLDQFTLSSLPGLYCPKNTLDITLDTCNKSFLKVESVEKLFGILASDTVDLSLRRSATEQLAVVLQDTAMHPVLKSLGITDKLMSFVMESVNGNKSMDCLLESSFCALRKLVYADPALRHGLARRPPLLLLLLRAVLMCLLLFDEMATVDAWSEQPNMGRAPATFSLPPSVTRRYNIPFHVETHHAVSPYCCVLTPAADLLTFAPARHALQLAWNTAWYSGLDNLLEELRGVRSDVSEFDAALVLSEAQVLSARTSHLSTGLQDCVQDIVTASGHASVRSALARLRLYLLIDRLAFAHGQSRGCRETLGSLTWQSAIARFLQVRPACVADERLLVDIVAFLNVYFEQNLRLGSSSGTEDGDLRWILELLLHKDTVSLCDFLLHPASPPRQHPRQSLRVSDAPRFYGLPSLERTLLGMVTLTALPGWSSQCPDLEPISLCSKYLSGLLEVISSFYVEWGGNSMSFMGKGVTKNAVICLLTSFPSGPWAGGARSEETSGSQLGLAWLIPLWVDRDPEVRFSSLGVGRALSREPSGCRALCASCQNISGGLWGTLLNILLDQQECSMVRREAAFILRNLLVMPMPANAEEAKDSSWKALLYHCQYFQHVAHSVAVCYRGRHAFHLQPPTDGPQGPSPPGSTAGDSEDSLNFWRNSLLAAAVNPSRASSSLSTSSTVIRGSGTHTPRAASPLVPSADTPASRLVAQVTPDLVTAQCALLTGLLAALPDFTLAALRRDQLLKALAGLLDVRPIEQCLSQLKTPDTPTGEHSAARSQAVTLLRLVSGFSRLLRSCLATGQEPVDQMDFLGGLLTTLMAVLLLDTTDLDAAARGAVTASWADVFCLLAALVTRDGPATLPAVSAVLAKRRRAFAVSFGLVFFVNREVRLSAEILRNALYRNDGCKVAAVDARLPGALHALWPWLLLDDAVMEASLELLCVYTAGCSAACSSLCGGPGGTPVGRGPPSSSLMHCVMKLASGIAADNSPVQKLAFSLLSNLAMSRDCRCILQKSNFLQLLVSLSFGEDGQQSILKVPGALEVLAGLAGHRRHALLTLHNLCSCPANKAHLLSNDKAMKVLVCSLDSKETVVRSMGASALWALLHNSQKAKTNLKRPSVLLRLERARAVAKKDAVKGQDSINAYLLKCLENLARLFKT